MIVIYGESRMSIDQRQSYRVSDERKAVICIGRKEHVVQLRDTSIGGFAILSKKKLPLVPDKRYRLRTSLGWFEVDLARQDETPDGQLYGLNLVDALEDPRSDQELCAKQANGWRRSPKPRNTGFWILAAIAAGLLVYLQTAFPERAWWRPLAETLRLIRG